MRANETMPSIQSDHHRLKLDINGKGNNKILQNYGSEKLTSECIVVQGRNLERYLKYFRIYWKWKYNPPKHMGLGESDSFCFLSFYILFNWK